MCELSASLISFYLSKNNNNNKTKTLDIFFFSVRAFTCINKEK
jgi:hypothetical protein